MKVKNQPKKKAKYNMFQNSWFMIKLAWKKKEKKVIFMVLLLVLLGVALNLINLYIAPTILNVIETGASFTTLITTISAFIIALILTHAL